MTAGAHPDADRKRDALSVLQRHWGYSSFRHGQWTAMDAVLGGRDALTILPTGGGKSLCYQVPALLLDGITLVVSPLVALMDDQVEQLTRRGIRATFINSTLSPRQIEDRWNAAMFGGLKLLYLAPERLQTDVFMARVGRLRVSLLAVDEAHCISEWGHSFRPSYLRIAEARTHIGNPPTIAVTATATPYVRRDIAERLALEDPVTVVTGFDRPNLTWSIFRTENKRDRLLEILRKVPGCGIVYAGTRRGTEEWASWLTRQGVSATFYHGGLSPEARSAAQARWIHDETRIMVATNAFGMGIDKAEVRFVVHVDLPSSLESYYQEAGRGGRDGKRSHAVLLYRNGDADTPRRLLEKSHPDRALVRRVYETLCSLCGVALGELPEGALVVGIDRIAEASRVNGSVVASILDMLARQAVLIVEQPPDGAVLLRFTAGPEVIRGFAEMQSKRALRAFVNDMLRTVPATAFGSWHQLPIGHLAQRLGTTEEHVRRGLDFLSQRELLTWHEGSRLLLVTFVQPRSVHVPYDEQAASRARQRSQTRLDDMLRYARTATCRRRFLLAYFGEPAPERCGKCDVCLGRHAPLVVTPKHEPILRGILAAVGKGMARDAWFEGTRPPADLDGLVDWMIREGYLGLTDPLEEQFELTEKGRRFLPR